MEELDENNASQLMKIKQSLRENVEYLERNYHTR